MAAISDDLVLWHALYGLEVRYWHEVDRNDGADAHSFYTADGVFVVGENEFRGRERIQHLCLARAARHGDRAQLAHDAAPDQQFFGWKPRASAKPRHSG